MKNIMRSALSLLIFVTGASAANAECETLKITTPIQQDFTTYQSAEGVKFRVWCSDIGQGYGGGIDYEVKDGQFQKSIRLGEDCPTLILALRDATDSKPRTLYIHNIGTESPRMDLSVDGFLINFKVIK